MGTTGTGAPHAVRREYARLAARYDRRWAFYVEASTAATLARIAADRPRRVLDVGCGTGALLDALATRFPDTALFGADASPEMLSVAAEKLAGRAHLHTAHAERLPYADGAFDLVVSVSALHYMPDAHAALSEMRRVLAPGGRLVVTDWCDDYLACRLCDLYLRLFDHAHVRTYGRAACERLLSDAGFGPVSVERYRISALWGLMTAQATNPEGRRDKLTARRRAA